MQSLWQTFVNNTIKLNCFKLLGNRGAVVLWWLIILMGTASSAWSKESVLEKSVCGVKEPFVFWLWSSMAGTVDAARVAGFANVASIAVSTKDGRILQGYQLKALSTDGVVTNPQGYLLVAQGNAMLADQIVGSFMEFSRAGLDVYIFDYRGYGRSQGKRRLKAMVSDYREIISYLDSQHYSMRLFYGMSFGGIVLLHALHGGTDNSRVVVDSTPSRLSDYGCPQEYDPVGNLPQDSSNLFLIVGLKDQVVTPVMSKELVAEANERGASVMIDSEMAHPFMDQNSSVHKRRMTAIKSFLLKK